MHPSRYGFKTRPFKGNKKRRNNRSRCRGLSAWKRSRMLRGNCCSQISMKCARLSCQKGVERKSLRHHSRQRSTVRAGTPRCFVSQDAALVPRGLTRTNTAARYTRRPRNRTEAGIVRWRQREQSRLVRHEKAVLYRAGHPRGLRGKPPSCSFAPQCEQPCARVAAASSSSIAINRGYRPGSCSNVGLIDRPPFFRVK